LKKWNELNLDPEEPPGLESGSSAASADGEAQVEGLFGGSEEEDEDREERECRGGREE
jgi:hypothetical protein